MSDIAAVNIGNKDRLVARRYAAIGKGIFVRALFMPWPVGFGLFRLIKQRHSTCSAHAHYPPHSPYTENFGDTIALAGCY